MYLDRLCSFFVTCPPSVFGIGYFSTTCIDCRWLVPTWKKFEPGLRVRNPPRLTNHPGACILQVVMVNSARIQFTEAHIVKVPMTYVVVDRCILNQSERPNPIAVPRRRSDRGIFDGPQVDWSSRSGLGRGSPFWRLCGLASVGWWLTVAIKWGWCYYKWTTHEPKLYSGKPSLSIVNRLVSAFVCMFFFRKISVNRATNCNISYEKTGTETYFLLREVYNRSGPNSEIEMFKCFQKGRQNVIKNI